MIIPEEVVCRTCRRVFCCPNCREKHELKAHAIVVCSEEPVLYLICPICQNRPLVLHSAIHRELLIHITEKHLPLSCQKCSKLYQKVEDLLEFTKCIKNEISCKLEIPEISSLEIEQEPTFPPQNSHASTVSTQTSPIRIPEIDDSHVTPISMINLRWKAKSKIPEEFISDSVSSIKNISSINNSSIRKSIGLPATKGKLVRSTSTPLQAELFAKQKEQAFNVFGGHVSSIYNSASDPESSPPLAPSVGTPSKRPAEPVNHYQKSRCRGKMSIAVTPLRQVMSKSIQKAIAEHGLGGGTKGAAFNRKKMFDSVDSSGDISEKSTEHYPLDLRLSPALRRTQSEIIDRKSHLEFLSTLSKEPHQTLHREILLSSTKKTTQSITITSKSRTTESITGSSQKDNNSVYKSCRSVEIVTSTSTELSEVNIKQNKVLATNSSELTSSIPTLTPRIPNTGVLINKKLIKFETPVVVQKCETEKPSPDETFFTPISTPVRPSKVSKDFKCESSLADSLARKFYSMEEQDHENIESFGSEYTDIGFDDEVFVENKKPEQGKSKLWSLVASMMRLPSRKGDEENRKLKDNTKLNENSTSLIKRCASFAGSLVRPQSLAEDDGHALKRKRTYTADSQMFDLTCSESKRFRINGRKPIQRMRCNQ